jgi:CheY-like chemotaxis protein
MKQQQVEEDEIHEIVIIDAEMPELDGTPRQKRRFDQPGSARVVAFRKNGVGPSYRFRFIRLASTTRMGTLAHALHRLGYHADLAGGGKAAIEALSSAQYLVVLLDCEMPEMDGYATTAEIRRRENGGRRTMIVAMTAHALEGARLRCLDAGMDEYVAKPVTLQALAAVLERCAALAKKTAHEAESVDSMNEGDSRLRPFA